MWINDTTTMTVAGVSGFVLHINGSGIVVSCFDVYLRRATGLVVKGNFRPSGWINVTLISTNVWSLPEAGGISGMTLVAIGEGAVIVALIAVMALRGRGKKKQEDSTG